MTDVHLHHAIFLVSNRLLCIVGQWVMKCFDGRPVNDERFKWAMPTTVHAHVQLGFTSASDSAWLAAKGLELTASAAALGPIRDVAETLARLARTAVRKRDRLAEIAAEDGVVIEKLPPTTDLFERYLHDVGGYPLFSTLSRAASHPGSSRPFLFYASPTKGMAVDFDFQGMHATRAFWLSKNLQLFIALCRLVGPELNWSAGWRDALDDLAMQLEPLTAEADRRVMTPRNETLKNFMDSAPE